jgi:hypothetical protein
MCFQKNTTQNLNLFKKKPVSESITIAKSNIFQGRVKYLQFNAINFIKHSKVNMATKK